MQIILIFFPIKKNVHKHFSSHLFCLLIELIERAVRFHLRESTLSHIPVIKNSAFFYSTSVVVGYTEEHSKKSYSGATEEMVCACSVSLWMP